MAEREIITKEKLEHSGLFVFNDLYSFMYRWLEEQGIGLVEKKYSEKVSGNSRDISVEWDGMKKLSDYYSSTYGIRIDVSGLTDVEVEIDGKKKKMNKGKVSVDIKGFLIIDPSGQWETTGFTRAFRDFYNKYIIPGRTESMRGAVASLVVSLKEEVKAFLDLTGKR